MTEKLVERTQEPAFDLTTVEGRRAWRRSLIFEFAREQAEARKRSQVSSSVKEQETNVNSSR